MNDVLTRGNVLMLFGELQTLNVILFRVRFFFAAVSLVEVVKKKFERQPAAEYSTT